MASFMYICASPLVKIFLPEWHDQLMANPEIMHDYETPFSFSVDSGTNSYVVQFNTPQQVEANDYQTGLNLYNWLTGGSTGATSRDTDCYGIVQFNPKIDMASTLDAITMLEALETDDPKKAAAAKKKADEKRKESRDAIKAAHAQVRKASEARILRALRLNHSNILRQWQTSDEAKIGRHAPSTSEMLGFKALAAEIAALAKKGESIKSLANEMMQRPNM